MGPLGSLAAVLLIVEAVAVTHPDNLPWALANVAEAPARAGQGEQAAVIARRAEEATRSIARVSKQEQALSCVAQALACGGAA